MNTVVVARNVVTLDPSRPQADALAVSGDRITFVGDIEGARRAAGSNAELLVARHATVVPGIIDPHFHLFATAARRLSLDCSSERTIADLIGRLHAAAAARPAGQWIRAFGYDQELLAERRHPTRQELDLAGTEHPIKLDHRTGHASVLNTRACVDLGLPLHDGVFFDSPKTNGVPTDELAQAVADTSALLLRYGITRLCDAGAVNGSVELDLLRSWRRSSLLLQEAATLVREQDAQLATGDGDVPAIGVKVVLEEHDLNPARLDALTELFRIRPPGAWIAIHVVELGALAILLDHLEQLAVDRVPVEPCRIEHLALCPPEWLPRLRTLGVQVVTQPVFLRDRREVYLQTVPRDQHDLLYPIARLVGAGVRVAASSDSPVGDPNPYLGMLTAIDRGAHCGARVGEPVPFSREDALRLYTDAAAAVVGGTGELGRIVSGYRADFAVLDGNPVLAPLERLPEIRAQFVSVGGTILEPGPPLVA